MADSEHQTGNSHVVPAGSSPDHEQQQQAAAPPEDQGAGAGAGAKEEAELLWKLRKYLVLLAILAAAITYQAGLAPPGGFWQDNADGHVASGIVLKSTYRRRYLVFFYCNTTAFVASLMVLILLLVSEVRRSNAVWLRSLQLAMVLGLLGLMGAFAAGSCREVRTSVYIWVLLLGIFAYVTLHVVLFLHFAWLRDVFSRICKRWKQILGLIFRVGSERIADAQGAPEQQEEEEEDGDDLERNRSSLLVLATLAATVTYAAGLSPPGGFWSDGGGNHLAGDPVLREHYPRRFKAFLICNATAFAASLVIIIMILSQTAVSHVVKSNALRLCVLVSLFGLMGAYAAGSCREVKTSIYVFALVGAVFLYLLVQFIGPAMPKPGCVENTIKCVKDMKEKMLKKLNELLEETENGSNNNNAPSTADDVKDDFQKLRTYLLLLGILAATVTYQAGLNPPGGFWTDNSDGHTAGDPILEVVNPKRYKAFFYCNATAFVASLVIIILLQSQMITMRAMKRYVLQTAMTLVLFGLMGAYVAGSSRKFSTSIYVFVLVLLVFAYVVLHALLYVALQTRLKSRIDTIYASMSKFLHYFTGPSEPVDNVPEGKDLRKKRKFLMLLAILAASVTYQAGISPPGGFWTDSKNGHRAGDSVFRDEFRSRYRVFFYFNATAFMASLAVILLLVSKRLCHKGLKCYALRACVLVDLISLMGAFATGSCRKVSTSAYVIVVVILVFVYVMVQVLVLTFAKGKVDGLLERMSSSLMRQDPSMNQRNSTQATPVHQRNSIQVREKSREHKWRKDLMLIGTLAITVTYQAGLLPPGGAWPDDRDNHFAGDPILHDTNLTRYRIFFYCNATSFMASMVMVILLLNNTISKYKRSLLAMKTAMVLDLLGLLGAYAAGSCRKFKTSVYIFALVIAVFIYIVIHVLLSFDKVARLVKKKGKKWMAYLKMSVPIRMGSNNKPSVEKPEQVLLPR
ncbi:uncharacterized protein [Lolium perenne]|uniref:uncharacterized protein n=1 Tax=Lolium perenne TaxID=4522 RepID=UPI0021EA7317|nr:uncharacterized protein LOC127317179 [Lolium perenne]